MCFFTWLNKFKNSVFKAGILHPLVSTGVLNCLIIICLYQQTKTNDAYPCISKCNLGHLHLHFHYSLSRKIHYPTFSQLQICILAIIALNLFAHQNGYGNIVRGCHKTLKHRFKLIFFTSSM